MGQKDANWHFCLYLSNASIESNGTSNWLSNRLWQSDVTFLTRFNCRGAYLYGRWRNIEQHACKCGAAQKINKDIQFTNVHKLQAFLVRAVIHGFLKEMSMLIPFLRDSKLSLAPVSHDNALNNMATAIRRNTRFSHNNSWFHLYFRTASYLVSSISLSRPIIKSHPEERMGVAVG